MKKKYELASHFGVLICAIILGYISLRNAMINHEPLPWVNFWSTVGGVNSIQAFLYLSNRSELWKNRKNPKVVLRVIVKSIFSLLIVCLIITLCMHFVYDGETIVDYRIHGLIAIFIIIVLFIWMKIYDYEFDEHSKMHNRTMETLEFIQCHTSYKALLKEEMKKRDLIKFLEAVNVNILKNCKNYSKYRKWDDSKFIKYYQKKLLLSLLILKPVPKRGYFRVFHCTTNENDNYTNEFSRIMKSTKPKFHNEAEFARVLKLAKEENWAQEKLKDEIQKVTSAAGYTLYKAKNENYKAINCPDIYGDSCNYFDHSVTDKVEGRYRHHSFIAAPIMLPDGQKGVIFFCSNIKNFYPLDCYKYIEPIIMNLENLFYIAKRNKIDIYS